MQALVHRIAAAAPDDMSGLRTRGGAGVIRAACVAAALPLGEIRTAALGDSMLGHALPVYSERASASAGVERANSQVLVISNSDGWSGDWVITQNVMRDAIDRAAVSRAIAQAGLPATLPIAESVAPNGVAVLAKVDAARSGDSRGARHIMLDQRDFPPARHARARVGGALACVIGTTLLYVSGGTDHQGPEGGGSLAMTLRLDRSVITAAKDDP